MIRITDTNTGEVFEIKGMLMVASNGTLFIKDGGKTVYASSATGIIAEVV